MIPTTTAQLFLFLTLVAPGLYYQLLRERHRPGVEESAFREASRIGLSSVVFDGAALIVLAIVRAIKPAWIPDVRLWLAHPGSYVQAHYALIIWAGLAGLALAFGFATVADRLNRKQSGNIRPEGMWFQLFRTYRPKDTMPWVSLRLTDGTEIAGFLAHFVPSDDPTLREIALRNSNDGTGLQLRRAEDQPIQELHQWSNIVVRGDQIGYFKVRYLPATQRTEVRRRWFARDGGSRGRTDSSPDPGSSDPA
jgi:hypothetical protein